jgi:hypothetical protein
MIGNGAQRGRDVSAARYEVAVFRYGSWKVMMTQNHCIQHNTSGHLQNSLYIISLLPAIQVQEMLTKIRIKLSVGTKMFYKLGYFAPIYHIPVKE